MSRRGAVNQRRHKRISERIMDPIAEMRVPQLTDEMSHAVDCSSYDKLMTKDEFDRLR